MRKRRREEKNRLYTFTMCVMCCSLLVLVCLINEEKKIITRDNLKNFKLSDVTQFLFWENFFPSMKEAVNAESEYQLLKDHFYSNGSNTLVAIMDGVIIKVEDNSLLQLCDNGVSILYKGIVNVDANKDERVLKGSPMGVIEESVEIYFYIDDEEISMEEALSIQ